MTDTSGIKGFIQFSSVNPVFSG